MAPNNLWEPFLNSYNLYVSIHFFWTICVHPFSVLFHRMPTGALRKYANMFFFIVGFVWRITSLFLYLMSTKIWMLFTFYLNYWYRSRKLTDDNYSRDWNWKSFSSSVSHNVNAVHLLEAIPTLMIKGTSLGAEITFDGRDCCGQFLQEHFFCFLFWYLPEVPSFEWDHIMSSSR